MLAMENISLFNASVKNEEKNACSIGTSQAAAQNKSDNESELKNWGCIYNTSFSS
jgi:hypothetical protein